MEALRQSWTDDRLDDLSRHMDDRFDRIEGEIEQRSSRVEGEIRDLRTEMSESDRELRNQLGALQRTMIPVGGGLLPATLTPMAAVIGLMVPQLCATRRAQLEWCRGGAVQAQGGSRSPRR